MKIFVTENMLVAVVIAAATSFFIGIFAGKEIERIVPAVRNGTYHVYGIVPLAGEDEDDFLIVGEKVPEGTEKIKEDKIAGPELKALEFFIVPRVMIKNINPEYLKRAEAPDVNLVVKEAEAILKKNPPTVKTDKSII